MKQFPIVRASGTHYEVGRAVGRCIREGIVKLFTNNKSLYPDYFIRFRLQAEELLQLTQNYFPQYVDELRGLADGAGLDMEELFLSNAHQLSYFTDPMISDHCTIIGIPSGNEYILGHNEDWKAEALEHLYILDADIAGIHIFGLGYDFANTIIGDSAAINQFGLVEAINELSHQDMQAGVPKAFVARAIIDCKTLEEAEDLIKTIPRRSGFNHLLVQGNRLWNIETSAKEFVTEKKEREKYVHTNHYITHLKRLDLGTVTSVGRYEKVQKLLSSINTIEDIKRVLTDKEDPQICRNETIGSVIIDVPNKVAHVAYGQPTPESYVEYSLAHVFQ